MSWYLGVDAGGSFTRAAMINPETGDCGEGHAGAGNPFSVSPDIAFDAIEQAVAGAMAQVGCHAFEVSAACLGVAGLGRRALPAGWTERFAEWRLGKVVVVSDLEIAHFAAFQGGTGIQVIAGTGSSVLVKDDSGNSHVYGGWGWLAGDRGSAVDLGRLAIAHFTRSTDAGTAPDDLVRATLAALKIESGPDLVTRLYRDPEPRQVLARLAPTVTALAAAGDSAACKLVEDAATGLAETVFVAVERLPGTKPVPVAIAGGVFRARVFAEAFTRHLDAGPRTVIVSRPRWSALAGAVLQAIGQSRVAESSSLAQSLLAL